MKSEATWRTLFFRWDFDVEIKTSEVNVLRTIIGNTLPYRFTAGSSISQRCISEMWLPHFWHLWDISISVPRRGPLATAHGQSAPKVRALSYWILERILLRSLILQFAEILSVQHIHGRLRSVGIPYRLHCITSWKVFLVQKYLARTRPRTSKDTLSFSTAWRKLSVVLFWTRNSAVICLSPLNLISGSNLVNTIYVLAGHPVHVLKHTLYLRKFPTTALRSFLGHRETSGGKSQAERTLLRQRWQLRSLGSQIGAFDFQELSR